MFNFRHCFTQRLFASNVRSVHTVGKVSRAEWNFGGVVCKNSPMESSIFKEVHLFAPGCFGQFK